VLFRSDLTESGPYVLGAGDITSENKIELSKAKHINLQKYIESPEIILEKGDSLIVKVGSTIGKVGFFNFDNIEATINPNSVIFRARDVDPYYIYYYLCTRFAKNFLISNSPASAQPAINQSNIKLMPVAIPTIDEQKSIGKILSSLDDKIELNNKINKTLEELAQTLYKQWFVDFEFPNEEGKPYKSSGGEMVESELGMIPKGWEVLPIKDKVEVVLGGTPSREIKDYWGGEVNWINSGKINDFRIISETEKITQIGLEKSAAKLMPIKTTVLAITGATLGQTSLLEIETSANQSVIGLIENDTFPYTYIFPLIQNEIDMIIQSQTGGAQQHINKNDVESYRILTPIFEILSSFDKLIGPSYELISNNLFENKHLSDLRDLLLPKLMSGEIEV
jgi:type I restriction enzyme S subunit